MSVILLTVILASWVWAAVAIARMLTSNLELVQVKPFIIFLVVAVIIPLPVADDIIGGFQFRALCKQGYTPVYDEAKANGKTVFLNDVPDKSVPNSLIPIREESWEYVDVNSRELLLSWKEYHAKGGWLSRFIGFPQGSPPYTFDAVCSSEGNYPLLKRLNIKTVNREKNHD